MIASTQYAPPLGARNVVKVRSKSAKTCRLWLPLRMMSFFFLRQEEGHDLEVGS
jgi:hypothetical protein